MAEGLLSNQKSGFGRSSTGYHALGRWPPQNELSFARIVARDSSNLWLKERLVGQTAALVLATQ